MFYIQMHYTLCKLSMATTGDPTDPRGTKRPNKDPILVSSHTFRPVIIVEHPCKVLWSPWNGCHKVLRDVRSLSHGWFVWALALTLLTLLMP